MPVALRLAVALCPPSPLRRGSRVVLLPHAIRLRLGLEAGALGLERLDRSLVLAAHSFPRVEERRVGHRQRLLGLPLVVEQPVHLPQRAGRVPLRVGLPAA
eukprot:scaffold37804_cov67-Phaeocystis_antarctica.AAC.5